MNGPDGSQAGQVRGIGNNRQGLRWELDSRGLSLCGESGSIAGLLPFRDTLIEAG